MTIRISNKVCGWTLFALAGWPFWCFFAAIADALFRAMIAWNEWSYGLHGWGAAAVGIGSALGMTAGAIWATREPTKEASDAE